MARVRLKSEVKMRNNFSMRRSAALLVTHSAFCLPFSTHCLAEACQNVVTVQGQSTGKLFLNLFAGQDFHEQWTMSGQIVCTNDFRLLPVSDFHIEQRPKHGEAGTNNTMASRGFAFRPNPGYVGDDQFTVSFIATNPIDHSQVKKMITVSVTVVK